MLKLIDDGTLDTVLRCDDCGGIMSVLILSALAYIIARALRLAWRLCAADYREEAS